MSALFTDRLGRSWSIVLDVGECRRVKRLHKVDLANWHDGEALAELLASDELLVTVLWCLLEEQAQSLQIDEEQFAKGLNGDVLAEALEAITQAVVGFTRPDRRELVRQIADKAEATHVEAMRRAINLVNSPEAQTRIDRELDKAMATALRNIKTSGQ